MTKIKDKIKNFIIETECPICKARMNRKNVLGVDYNECPECGCIEVK